jgi:hypothetical protein
VRKMMLAAAAVLLVVLGVVVGGCGSSNDSSSTSSSTPEGRLGASVAPPKLGYYAGIECARYSCDYYSHAREGMLAYCGSTLGIPGYHRGNYSSDFRGYNFVCFKLQSPNQLIDFWFAEQKIVRSVHVSSDRFPLTCDNGWCIQGEWFSTRSEQGRIRSPNEHFADYKAEWIAS